MKIFVKPYENYSIATTFNFMYCKKTNGLFNIKFKDGETIPFGANCFYKKPEVVSSLYISNPNDFELEVEMVFVFGEYGDNSTTIASIIQVENAVGQSLNINEKQYKLRDIEAIKINAEGHAVIDPAGATKIRIQNRGTININLFRWPDGFLLAPMGTDEITLKEPFLVFGIPDEKVILARFD